MSDLDRYRRDHLACADRFLWALCLGCFAIGIFMLAIVFGMITP